MTKEVDIGECVDPKFVAIVILKWKVQRMNLRPLLQFRSPKVQALKLPRQTRRQVLMVKVEEV
jgi:hypothetical protein